MDLLFLGCVRACNYILISVGFALVFGSCRVLNLMHGAFVMIGAYATYVFIGLLSPAHEAGYTTGVVVAAVLLAAIVTAFVGYGFFFLLQVTDRTDPRHVLAISVAGNLVIAQLFQFFYGTEGLNVPPILPGSAVLGSFTVPAHDLIIPPVAVMSFVSLWYWLNRTRSGIALRAVADDRDAARLAGINADRALTAAVAIAAFLAGLAGALTAPTQTLSADMWIHPLLVSFAVVVFGGRGSLSGAVIAASILAAVEVLTSWFWSEAASQCVALIGIVVGLVIRPTGLAGTSRYEAR